MVDADRTRLTAAEPDRHLVDHQPHASPSIDRGHDGLGNGAVPEVHPQVVGGGLRVPPDHRVHPHDAHHVAPDGTLRLHAQVAEVTARTEQVADARALGPAAIGRDPFTLHDADQVTAERIDQVDHGPGDGRREKPVPDGAALERVLGTKRVGPP